MDKAYRDRDPDKRAARAEYFKLWRARNRDRFLGVQKAWRQRNHARKLAGNQAWRLANPDAVSRHSRAERDRLRTRIFDHYGWDCTRCGFDDERALTLDHVHNDGAADRQQMRSPSNFYRRVIKAGFPDRYQTLCANCQLIKAKDTAALKRTLRRVVA